MKSTLILVLAFMFMPIEAVASYDIKVLLKELDTTIANEADYIHKKERKITELRKQASLSTNKDIIYNCYGRLFDEYRSFNADSAFFFAQKKLDLANELNNKNYICDAKLNLADMYSRTGMFGEALKSMDFVSLDSVPLYLKPYYFHLLKSTYEMMALYAVRADDIKKYTENANYYRQLLLNIKEKNTTEYVLLLVDNLIYSKKYNDALKLLLAEYKKNNRVEDHSTAFVAFSLAHVYKAQNNNHEAIRFYAISAICDFQSSVKEYAALRELAMLLYQQGDIDHAYKYLKQSMEDAKESNARLRTVEIADVFPIIDDAYNKKNESQQKQIIYTLIGISLLAIFLLIAIYSLYNQMKKLAVARANLNNSNEELNRLNKQLLQTNVELRETNKRLKETNLELEDASTIKEEYIGRYMDLCSVYLEQFESYRKSLNKYLVSKNMEKLSAIIKSSDASNKELKEFYNNFDSTFLRLFPTFVDDFNKLLNKEERIYPKKCDSLNTELRIYALIRLGISDSVKIAKFLRYSVTTIYNYRTRIRNKAIGDRDDLEIKVKLIGREINN